jgi:2,4-dichlorophenol 6-monooxygenase
MQDAFNLAWKLSFVLKGHAGPGLLDSYSVERAPVGAQIVKRANQSRIDYGPLNDCFRDPAAAQPVAAGLALLADPGPEGVARRAELAKALKVKNFEFNAQGVELNQRYMSAAVVPDADAAEEVWARDPQLHLQATTRPGAKMPHAWLVGADGRRSSTLDLVGHGKYSLVTGLSGAQWAEAADGLQAPFLRTVVIGTAGAQDLYCNWSAVREIEEAGALLVRPDGVVAWRQHGAAQSAAEAKATLDAVLKQLLGTDAAKESP